mmetsp:Transcript_23775/g.35106  ORF Transcript_23775/g.35106 Transcript_23775/m.35106 type:complete len:138 (-) Transcript_23775:66-479(-)
MAILSQWECRNYFERNNTSLPTNTVMMVLIAPIVTRHGFNWAMKYGAIGGSRNFFGTALSLSSDGKVLAIGSPGASGSGLSERHVGLTTIYRFGDNEEAPQKTQPPIMVNSQYPNFARSRKGGSVSVCIPLIFIGVQ